MVDIALLQSVSYIAGALGVCVAALYYVMMLRSTEKIRRRDLVFQRLQVPMQQHYDAFYTVMKMTDWKTTEEFERKYGYLRHNPVDAIENAARKRTESQSGDGNLQRAQIFFEIKRFSLDFYFIRRHLFALIGRFGEIPHLSGYLDRK